MLIEDSSISSEEQCPNLPEYVYASNKPSELRQNHDYNSRNLSKTRSNRSELSRIVTAIQDDRMQDADEYDGYRLRDMISDVVSEMEINSRISESQGKERDIYEEKDVSNVSSVEVEDEHIDRGFSWIIALCTMLCVLSTWGANAGYGVFLSYYLTSDVFAGAGVYDFALVGGIVVFCAQFFAPVVLIMMKIFGFHNVGYLGISLQAAGYLLASFATDLWQVYLTEGLLVGLGFVMIFIPTTVVLPSYFNKYRAFAFGLSQCGAGLGGLIYSLSVSKLIQTTGDQRWALRMCCITTTAMSATAITIIRPKHEVRLPLRQTLKFSFLKESIRTTLDFSPFSNYPLLLVTVWYLIILMGYTLMLFSVASYASLVGLSAHQGSILTCLLNTGQAIGRPIIGLSGDRFGRNNLACVVCFIISILLFAYWINAVTFGALIPFALILGFFIGIGSLMAQSLAIDIIENLPKMPAIWSGMNIIVLFFCLVAEVIALALRDSKSSRPFLHTQIFSGCCFFVGALILLINREWLVRRKIKQRMETAQRDIAEYEDHSSILDNQSGYDDRRVLQERIVKYKYLLKPTISSFFLRMIYPIRT